MGEKWLMPGAVVPVDHETTKALIDEIKRLIGIIGGMALNQRTAWVGLTDDEMDMLVSRFARHELARAIEAKLKEKNT